MNERERTYLQTSEQWTWFLSALLHELGTPLASFRTVADLLAATPAAHLGQREKHYAENLRQMARDLQDLVDDAAELARLLAGRAQFRREEFALKPLVHEVEDVVRPRAWESGIALNESLDPALPRLFRTDPERLRQALTLLLGAAVSRAKSAVLFRLDIDDQDLRIVISSDGSPFPEERHEALFEPWSGGLRSARPRGERSLALPLAYEMIRGLKGTLQAENRGGRPSFDLTLPAA